MKDPGLPLKNVFLYSFTVHGWLAAKWCLSSFDSSLSEPFEVKHMLCSVPIFSLNVWARQHIQQIWRGSKLSAQFFDGTKGERAIIFPLIIPKVKQ